MAFSRKALKAMGLTDEQVDTLVDMHTETVDALKAQISTYKADAEKLGDVQKQLNEANEKLVAADADGFKTKYEAEKQAFEDYKAEVDAKETKAAKAAAYKAVLAEAGLKGEKLIETVIKSVDFSKVELDGDTVKDKDNLIANIKTEWADYITTESTKKPPIATPPKNNQAKTFTREEIKNMTPAEINANWAEIKTSLKGV